MVAESEVHPADHLIRRGVGDPKNGPAAFAPSPGGALDIRACLSVVRQLPIPAHPLPDVRLGIERADGGHITLSARPKDHLGITERRIRRNDEKAPRRRLNGRQANECAVGRLRQCSGMSPDRASRGASIPPDVEPYDIRLRARSTKDRAAIRDHGSVWTVIGTKGPNVLIVSPPTMPTYVRVIRAVGDPNFEVVEGADPASH